jgi:ABC-type multidrug transport system fused ATPase/permease subunit
MLQNGEIIEQGTHEELINQGGAYSRLYDTQQKLENYGKEEIA